MEEIGFWLPSSMPITDFPEITKLADELGYYSAWASEGRHGDQFSILNACAMASKRIMLGTNVSSVFVRSAPLIGMAAATVDIYSNGRFILGLGTDHRSQIIPMHGLEFSKPIPRIRETVDIVRQLWRDDEVSYPGEILNIQKFDFMYGFKPVRKEIPIYLGAVFPKMLGIAGEISNGAIMINYNIDKISEARGHFIAGAERAGKRPEDVVLSTLISTLAAESHEEARHRMRLNFTKAVTGKVNLSRYSRLQTEMGFGEERAAMFQALAEGDRERAMSIISDEYPDKMTITGTPGECKEKIEAFRAAGIDLPLIHPLGDKNEIVATLKALAPG